MDAEILRSYREFFEQRMLAGESAADIRKALLVLCVPFEKRCAFCPNPATRYCDFVIGVEKKGTQHVPARVIPATRRIGGKTRHFKECGTTKPYDYDYCDFDSEQFTCDLNLCDDCATQTLPSFACWNRDLESKCSILIDDFCPEHADASRKLKVMTAQEARVLRNRMALRVISRHPLIAERTGLTVL